MGEKDKQQTPAILCRYLFEGDFPQITRNLNHQFIVSECTQAGPLPVMIYQYILQTRLAPAVLHFHIRGCFFKSGSPCSSMAASIKATALLK